MGESFMFNWASQQKETMLRLICLVACVALCSSHSTYMDSIPNGHSLPNPCGGSGHGVGAGHWNITHGGGAQNPFGDDFAKEGHMWTVNLCQMDSDGDGMSNGAEVGDLSC